MNYFEITAKCEEVNESSYTVQSTGEIVTKIQLSLVVPSMRDRVLCELPVEKAPTTDQLSKWELDESWLVVSADGMRALAFQRSNARAGEKPVGALVVFQAVAVREATADERKQLQEARSAMLNDKRRNKPSSPPSWRHAGMVSRACGAQLALLRRMSSGRSREGRLVACTLC